MKKYTVSSFQMSAVPNNIRATVEYESKIYRVDLNGAVRPGMTQSDVYEIIEADVDKQAAHRETVEAMEAQLRSAVSSVNLGNSFEIDLDLVVTPANINIGANTTTRDLRLLNQGKGVGQLSWNIADDADWLNLNPDSGKGDATVQLTVDRTSLADGTYNASVTVSTNGGNTTVPVTMVVLA